LLKNSYFKADGYLETLPNIDINIKCGNSLISQYDTQENLTSALNRRKWTVKKYLDCIRSYQQAKTKASKQIAMQQIEHIKMDIITSIQSNDSLYTDLRDSKAKLALLKNQIPMFSPTTEEKKLSREKIATLQRKCNQLQAQVDRRESFQKINSSFEWRFEFPEVLDSNGTYVGFDVIIGNPPYIGEKGHKEIFRPVRTTYMKKYYKRKMDIFYFFFHLAIDLVKNNGHIGYITTNYYITATEANKLRYDFKTRTCVDRLINFNQWRIFDSAQGQHNMITFLKKDQDDNYLADTFQFSREGSISQIEVDSLSQDTELIEVHRIPQSNLYDGEENYIRLTPTTLVSSSSQGDFSFEKIDRVSQPLKEFSYAVHRGVETGCDFVTNSLLKKAIEKSLISKAESEKFRVGSGIYVLPSEDFESSDFNEYELDNCIKPFYKNSQLHRYYTEKKNPYVLLYIDSHTNASECHNILAHLQKYRKLLAAREQAVTDTHNWYWIRGSKRNQYFYRDSSIVVPYRSETSRFSLCRQDIFGAGDTYYVALKKPISNELFLGYLNSATVWFHLIRRGKLKGKMIEYYKKPLEDIPIHNNLLKDKELAGRIESLVKEIIRLKQASTCAKTSELERRIDLLIYSMFAFTENDISAIEKTINNHMNQGS